MIDGAKRPVIGADSVHGKVDEKKLHGMQVLPEPSGVQGPMAQLARAQANLGPKGCEKY